MVEKINQIDNRTSQNTTKKFYLSVIGKDGSSTFFFSRTRQSVIYGFKPNKFDSIGKLHCSYHKDGGGRFFHRSYGKKKRQLLKWQDNDKVPLLGGDFHMNKISPELHGINRVIRLKNVLTELQYNLWLAKPRFKAISDLPKNKIKIIRRSTIRIWPDFWIHIEIFTVTN